MKRSFFYFVVAFVSVVTISSCGLSGGGNTNPPVAQFAFVQASPDAPTIDAYANGGIICRSFPYTNDTGYFVVSPGTYTIQVTPAGSITTLLSSNVTFAPATSYSIYTIDSVSKLKAAVVADNFNFPPSDSVLVRFFHFSPNEPAVDFGVTGITAPWYGGRTFNDQSTTTSYQSFMSLPAGTYNLEARVPGTSTAVASAPGTILAGGKIYTIYLKGFDGGTGVQALSIGNVIHNQ